MDNKPFWTDQLETVAGFNKIQNERLRKAQEAVDRMLGVKETRTIENTLAPYDEALTFLDSAGPQTELVQEVHPDEDFRTAAEELSQKISAFSTGLSLNREVFDALSAMVDLAEADDETRYYVQRTLRDFRLAGVDKDAATREKIKALRDELVLIGQEFSRNIRDDKENVIAESVSELDGLPQDYIDNHKPDAGGRIVLTTDYPDYVPVMAYAKSEDLRRRMYFAFNNRAYPQNIAVLERLAAKRYELANLLGFKTWADFATADKMIKSAANASDFIDKIVEASGARARFEYHELLKRKQEDAPGATAVYPWESTYYSELLRKENYNFDSQSVRPFFPYNRVKQGVLDVTSKLFGVVFEQVKSARVWHPSVECWEMFENGELAGRFYLDMHPRMGKYNHAAQFGVRTGVAGKQIPEAALVCNFPGGAEAAAASGDEGLMQFSEVNTFFHEFGHLLHTLFAGRRRWVGIGGITTEWDFVEAPSQLLEEWAEDAATLQTFARHYKTNEPIPAALVEQLRRAENFGKGLAVRRQMAFARLSLSIYDRRPEPNQFDTDQLVKQIFERYSPFPTVEGVHMQTSFGHLDGYSAIYYTYMWSLVLAKDMFSQFDKSNLLAPDIARRYRQQVLEPAGSKPAEKLVESFLDRPSDFTAWQEWLNENGD